MANIIDQIMQFFTSDEFQALMTSIGSILLAISPFIYKKITSNLEKWKIRVQGKSEELKEALELVSIFEAKANEEAIVINSLVNQVNDMMKAQSEAMALAFNRSNLKEDVKNSISNILRSPTKTMNAYAPIGQAKKPIEQSPVKEIEIDNRPIIETETLTEDEKKFDDTLPTQTSIEKPKPKRVF